MYIVMVATECAPVAKVGGLADVVHGLARELEILGNAVEIILPKYDCMRYQEIRDLHPVYENLSVPWGGGAIQCTVWFGHVRQRKCYFIDPHSWENFFNRGAYYGFYDDPARFTFFAKAALEFMLQAGKRPDVIHTHDWQTALTSVLLFEIYKHAGMVNQRVCHTIHNFKHQGSAGEDLLWACGLGRPDYYCSEERLGNGVNPHEIQFTRGAIVYANFINTVSPQHAWEARFTDEGYGLGHLLHVHQDKFGGVLNGLDYEVWNPETDPDTPHHYNVDTIENKRANTDALRRWLLLRDEEMPIVAYVGRLDPQKGLHLIRHALFYSIWNRAQFVLLGAGAESGINDQFWHIKHYLNDNPDCHLEIGFDDELAHLIYAGANFIIVPSMYEPCGLTQLIGLRYGTVPIVRSVGGLSDTVFDWDHSERPVEQRNGYVFIHPDYPGIESAMSRAFELWHYSPVEFMKLARNGMRCDYSWAQPAEHYLRIYDHIRHR